MPKTTVMPNCYLNKGSAEHIYDVIYCARGEAENLIKMHKSQLASDRTSCRSPIANQVRLILHTAAYWLMLTLRDTLPRQPIFVSALRRRLPPAEHAEASELRDRQPVRFR